VQSQKSFQKLLVWRACNLTAFTQSHWSSGSTLCFLSWGTRVQSPRGYQDSPVSVVLLHWWPRRNWSLWPRLRRALSWTVTRPSCWKRDNPTWSHTAFLSQFHARCRSSFRLHNRHSRLLGGALWRACNLTAFTQSLWSSGLSLCFPSLGTRVQSVGGYLCETGILLLALSRYTSTHVCKKRFPKAAAVVHFCRFLHKVSDCFQIPVNMGTGGFR
jgi:hypothetical protein